MSAVPSSIAAAPDATPAVELRDISKSFGALRALEGANLSLRRGQIHALLGENGAGKSTLMQVLAGIQQPDSGTIHINDRAIDRLDPRCAIALGIGMVHQNFQLIPGLSVAENVLLGGSRPRWWLGRRAGHDELCALAARHGLQVDPASQIDSLSVGQQQQIEILKALWRGARTLILDEPTAVLGPQQVPRLFQTLRELARDGVAVVLITHRLHEVLEVADRVTVLRRGRVVAADLARADTDEPTLSGHILGVDPSAFAEDDAITGRVGRGRLSSSRGPVRLALHRVSARGDRDQVVLQDVTLELRAGQILGVAGVSGNGQAALCDVVMGLRPVSQGCVELDGVDVTHDSVLLRRRRGLGYIPEDRNREGLAGSLSILHNALLWRVRAQTSPWLRWRELEQYARRHIDRHSIRLRDLQQPAAQLSGGNAQRLVLAREVGARTRLLVAAQPTRGLDLAAAHNLRSQLSALASAGCSVLLISQDLDELIALADRVAVLFAGRVVDVLADPELSIERIGQLMLGAEATP